MYWKVIFTNAKGTWQLPDFIIANNYNEVMNYAKECAESSKEIAFYWIYELSEKQRRKNNLWIDLTTQ